MNNIFKTYHTKFLLLITGLFFLASCHEATVEVRNIPGNTPAADPIYISGNFNNWDPGDETYRLQLMEDSTYQIALPLGFGRIEYKFTRGDWSTVEKDICGYEMGNRSFYYGDQEVIIDTILSWGDKDPENCPTVTIILQDLPENTPRDARISIAGSFNNWDTGDEDFYFNYDSNINLPVITIPRELEDRKFWYKITRGSLLTEEVDALGFEISPREFTFGEADSVFISVENWEDLGVSDADYITYIIDKVPENTPASDLIYYLGDINSWYPRDKSLVLKKTSDGRYFIRFPREKQGAAFKFSRGDWNSIEVDAYGYGINNRFSSFEDVDTVYLSIENWKDLAPQDNSEIQIRIVSIPANTPSEADIYIAGNFNGWDPGSEQWKLNKNSDNTYTVAIPRNGGNLEFKFTRGNWSRVESSHGEDIDNRTYLYRNITHLDLKVDDWLDLDQH